MQIDSTSNPRIKAVTKLWESGATRRERGLFMVEGARELSRALTCGYRALEAYILRDHLSEEARKIVAELQNQKTEIIDVSPAVFGKLAVREEKDGIVCVMQMKHHALADLKLPKTPFLLAAEKMENPGNAGALLRTADGAGADAVILIDCPGDLYNPHTIRASIGTVFSVPVALCRTQEFIAFCREKKIATFGAALDDRSQPYTEQDFTQSCAVILGSEADGLTPELMKNCDHLIQIPMRGIADSLNISVAGAILAYEVVRQRMNRM